MDKGIEIKSSKQLKDIFVPDKPTRGQLYREDANGHNYYCDSVLISFNVRSSQIWSERWFINSENELVYDIGKNKFMNLDMFDKGTSRMRNLMAFIKEPFSGEKRQMSLFS